jgi:hypothetical protein
VPAGYKELLDVVRIRNAEGNHQVGEAEPVIASRVKGWAEAAADVCADNAEKALRRTGEVGKRGVEPLDRELPRCRCGVIRPGCESHRWAEKGSEVTTRDAGQAH